MLCVINKTSGGNSSGKATDQINATDCGVLAWATRLASSSAAGLAHDVSKADPQITAVRSLLTTTTGWHEWAATLPLFALTCTAVAVVAGTIAGRRNLLVLAQFCSVIVWWMTCAVISVEFAISVGMSDACVDPVATMLRVLRTVAAGSRSSEPSPASLWLHNVSGHYVVSCSMTDPLQSSLGAVLTGLEVINVTLMQLSTDCGEDPSFASLQQAGAVVRRCWGWAVCGHGRRRHRRLRVASPVRRAPPPPLAAFTGALALAPLSADDVPQTEDTAVVPDDRGG